MLKIIVTIYTAKELMEAHPKGWERAHNRFLQHWENPDPWCMERQICYEKFIEMLNLPGKWKSYFLYDNGRWGNDEDAPYHITGHRANTWVENNIIDPLRISFTAEDRWKLSKYGPGYRAGMVKPCPITGVCYDEEFLEHMTAPFKGSESLGKRIKGLYHVYTKMCEREYEEGCTPDFFNEECEANGRWFDADGDAYYPTQEEIENAAQAV